MQTRGFLATKAELAMFDEKVKGKMMKKFLQSQI
jgi:hypothetical protein